MRTPLRQKSKVARGQTATLQSVPAPVGGWNARDALAQMDQLDAVALENLFPRPTYCEVRGGCSDHATGMTGNGKTLATYNQLSGTNKMYCYTPSGIYDVSSAGAVGSSKLARTEGKHQWVNFGDGTNNYLIAVNGVDKPAYFDGTTWTAVDGVSTPALTGLTTTKIVHVCVFKGRLIFVEKDSLSFWYLAAGAAGGALTEFPLDSYCPRGGYLMAAATWTIDSGSGFDDRLVLITSEGECLIYEGTNPSSAASWQQVGTYFLGKPLGRKCFTQYGGDLVILTENGAFPLSAALQSASVDYKLALSFKIENAFTEAARLYGSVFGWRATVYPAQSAMIVNIPIAEGGDHEQYVMNTITKSWCKFKEWDAEDFVVYNKELYFTTSTKVVKAWTGTSDYGNNIVWYGKQAFNSFGRANSLKAVKLYSPILSVSGNLSILCDIDVDFRSEEIVGTATYSPPSSSLWGTAIWGTSLWGSGTIVLNPWTSPAERPGYYVAGKIKGATKDLSVAWMASSYAYEIGGIL